MSLLGRTLGQVHCHWYVCRPGLLFGHPWTRYYMSYKNVVNTTQQENTRSNKNVKFFWRKPFSVETPSLGEKSFLGRSHFWGEALFGEKPFSGRSHFLGRSHSGEKPFSVKKPFSGRSHFSSVFWHYFEKNSNFCSLSPPVYCLISKDLVLPGEYNRIWFIYVPML